MLSSKCSLKAQQTQGRLKYWVSDLTYDYYVEQVLPQTLLLEQHGEMEMQFQIPLSVAMVLH